MNTTDNALTEAERLLLARVNDCTKPIDAADRNGILKLIDRLAASQSSQPAAAPIDKRCVGWAILNGVCVVDFSRDRAEADRTACEMQRSHDLSGSLASFHVEPVFIRTDAAPVPSPADERAAYHFHRFVDGVEMAEGVLIDRAPTLEAAIKEAVRCCEKRPMTVLVHAPAWAGTLCGGALANRAASANETQTCSHQWTWADGKCADCGMIAQQPHAESGMTLAERIAHVGGRITEGGYVEFGSAMAVDALIQHALRDARASANETGAEGVSLAMALNPNAPPLTMTLGPAQAAEAVAQWQSRLKDRSSPVAAHWVNISPDGAKTLMEKYADIYEVRALYAAPQPPAQAAAREGLTDEQRSTLESLARTSTPYEQEVLRSILATHPGQSEPRRSENPTGIGYDTPPEELERILAQGETRAEVTVDQPSLANPLTPYGMLVRALRIVAQTSLHDMGQALLLSPSKLSAMEFGREPVTPEIVREIGTYFESLGIHNMRPALQFAIDAATTGDQS
ncbi:hypothetical protein K6W12_03200 [Burkholderia multivorans]|uniref:hypothetical protein n=1 Tax=Burkholderia multivorans TaxID=87883 RepID=UPI001C945418|nr:hypothetical protein [Burkholderia multivorans]MBY4669637.1 hypothetical protein [Burkholderia multivorans]